MEQLKEDSDYELKSILKRMVFSLVIPLVSLIYPLLCRPTGKERIINTFIDDAIPFNKYFIIAYISWYVYVIFFLLYFSVTDKNIYSKLLTSISLGMLLSYVIFYFFPTYVPRPVITGKDIFSKLVLIIYTSDNPYNCFPSIHVLNSLLVAFYVHKDKKLKESYKFLSAALAFLIIISTMFVKQHYFMDVIAGALMAYMVYLLIEYVFENYIFVFIRNKHVNRVAINK